MTLSAYAYGSVAGVAAYVPYMTDTGEFTTQTTPTEAQVEAFLEQQSAKLNGWLLQAGHGTPVTNAQAVLILSNYANLGAAGLVELTNRSAGYDADDQNRRENKFLREFEQAKADILGGLFGALGVPQASGASVAQGVYVGGAGRGPIFTRTGFGNRPTNEQGTHEADQTWG
jgi:hypothetical protein